MINFQFHVLKRSKLTFFQPIKLTLDVHKCLVSDDPEFPVIKLNGALEDLNVIISDMTMIRLMTFLKEMKFPVTSTSSYVQPPVQSKTAPSLRYGKHSSAFGWLLFEMSARLLKLEQQ